MNTTIVVAIATAASAGLMSLALILWFLWRVYERGGRGDLTAAATALRQVHDPDWVASLGKLILEGGKRRRANERSAARVGGDL